MFTKLKIVLALSAGLIGAGATLAAAEGGAGRGAMIKKYDVDGDGKLSDSERATMRADMAAKHAAMKQKMLEKFDLNKDGKLDPAERKLMKEQRLETRFKKLDANGDGVVSFEEFKAGNLARGGMHRHHRHGGKPGGSSGAPGSSQP